MEPQETVADRLLSELLGRNNSRAEIHINAGGVGIWVATTACCVMLAVNLFLAAIVMGNIREISDLNDKLSAIYMLAPGLQPSDKQPKEKVP